MARIAGVDLPGNRRAVVALTHIYGISEPTAKRICEGADISENIRTDSLTPRDQGKLRGEVDKCRVEGDLRREVSLNIKHLVEIGSYRGIRHRCGLPVRGQNTKNSTRTRKGPEGK